jgi:hypothetical protein
VTPFDNIPMVEISALECDTEPDPSVTTFPGVLPGADELSFTDLEPGSLAQAERLFGKESAAAEAVRWYGQTRSREFDWAEISPHVQVACVRAFVLGSAVIGSMEPLFEEIGRGSFRVVVVPTVTVAGGDPDTVALTLAGFKAKGGAWVWRMGAR